MDQSQVRWALLKISLLSLLCSTWVFVSFVLETKPEQVMESSNNSVQPQPEDPLATLVRLPASIPAQLPANVFSPAVRVAPVIRMDVVNVNCWDLGDTQPQVVDARWMRLTGKPCQSDTLAEAIQISNLSNGYVGTVFAAQADLMTTDFIPLQEGSNDILLKFGHEGGVVFENRLVFVKPATEPEKAQ